MQAPSALSLYCENCDEQTLHRVVKGNVRDKNGKTLDLVAKCTICGSIYKGTIKAPSLREVPLIISERADSRKTRVELPEDEVIRLGDELVAGDDTILVTAIETDKKRVESASVSDIDTIWAKIFNTVSVAVSVNRGPRTLSDTIEAIPEEEFYIGDTIMVNNKNCVIHNIMAKNGRMVRRGGLMARDIKKIYAQVIRSHTSY